MRHFKICFIIFLWASNTCAWNLFSESTDINNYEEVAPNFDIHHNLSDQLNEVVLSSDHKKALAKLVELQNKPTCSRHAASRLLVSCSSLSGIKDDTSRGKQDYELEDMRNAYAVSLAICQFDQAGIETPEACFSFRSSAPSVQTARGGISRKARSEKEQLKSCLKSLYLDGSAWTTFTENHQTARVICEASRVHAERDRMIEVYKRRADVDSARTAHYFEELDNFVKSFDVARSQMAVGLEELENESRSVFQQLQEQFSGFADGLAEKLNGQFSEASAAAEQLLQTVVRGENELVTAQLQALNVNRDMVAGAQAGQDSVMAIHAVLQQVVDVVKDLQVQVAEIKQNNNAIGERSEGTLLYMQNITSQLQTVNALQEDNIERALYMAKIQDEAAESARYWSSWLRFIGVPTWQEVLASDARVLGMRWQVLGACLSSSLVGGNYGIEKRSAKNNSLLLVVGFMGSGIVTIAENTYRSMAELSEDPSPEFYHLEPTISIRTTPAFTSNTASPTPYRDYKHPHAEVR